MIKRVVLPLILLMLLLSSCQSSEEKEDNEPLRLEEYQYRLQIIQEGREVIPGENGFNLEKKSFVMRFIIPAPMKVLVSASFNPATYEMTMNGESFDAIKGFKWGGMADYHFNPDRSLFIQDMAYNLWYYTSPEDHRFDRVEEREGNIVCDRTVEVISDFNDDDGLDIPLVELAENTIYLSIFSIVRNEEGQAIEKQRDFFKLNFD